MIQTQTGLRPDQYFIEFIESLSQPLAVCDEDGQLICLNLSARRFLGLSQPPENSRDIVLQITTRDTFSSQRRVGHLHHDTAEFFMADVQVTGANIEFVSLSLVPMMFGGFRVRFIEEYAAEQRPGIQLLNALESHTTQYPVEDKTTWLSLFIASLVDVFPDHACAMTLFDAAKNELAHVEHTSPSQITRRTSLQSLEPVVMIEVSRTQLCFKESRWGHRFVCTTSTGLMLCLQLETTSVWGVDHATIESIDVFLRACCALLQPHESTTEYASIEPVGDLLNQMQTQFIWCDARRRIKLYNEAFAAFMGTSTAELVGVDILDMVSPEEKDHVRTWFSTALILEHPQPLSVAIKGTTDSITFQLNTSNIEGIKDVHSERFWLVAHAESEQNIAQQKRLQQLGHLATGVAHELKNPMTSILNYAQFFLQKYQAEVLDTRDRQRLHNIIDGVERMDRYIQDLVVLSRSPETLTQDIFDLHQVLSEATLMCDTSLHEYQVELHMGLNAQTSLVMGNRAQILQVFLNLMTNAIQSMVNKGGVLDVRSHLTQTHICVEIQDHGCGMDSETAGRLFEPFYTTKKTQGGSGLGLVLVQSILNHHNGQLSFESTPGQGTTFLVSLPLPLSQVEFYDD